MSSFIPFDRSQPYLLPPDLKSWLPSDDVAHFIVAAVERVALEAFSVPRRTGGKAQYHPRLMLALLIYAYANGVFSSRRIERATYRDIGMRFVAANLHPDHDTIAVFRRGNRLAIEAAFVHVLLLARETGLVRLGTVSIDGTKIDANASKYRSIRYDRAKELRETLATDIAILMERTETADTTDTDHQALPEELARREALKAKLDEACAQLEAEAREQAETARPEYERRKAAFDAKRGRRGRPPKAPDDEPPPDRQINLTDPDNKLMRRSDAHECRQAYNAQALVCAEGSQLILENGVVATTADAPSFAATILGMEKRIGLPRTVLADTGFASGKAIGMLQVGRPMDWRPYDFRPEPPPKEPRRITEPWRMEKKAKLQQNQAKALYALRKQTVEPVFGIIKSAMGFTRFHLRGLANVATEWTLVALAYNCRRITRLTAA
ncbi:transposase [Komagataeibacter swingsii]|nr:transposase [Komagataeibacter swingsii]GBQ66584.1 transposase [Komagataeibacter swingsii DSM 16373]